MNKPAAVTISAISLLAFANAFAESLTINRDGDYVYSVSDATLVVRSIKSPWSEEIPVPGIKSAVMFSANGDSLIFKSGDSLCIFSLRKKSKTCVPSVDTYKQPGVGKADWLTYTPKAPEHELVLWELPSGKERHFSSVTADVPEGNGKALLLNIETQRAGVPITELQWISPPQGEARTIWSAERLAQTGGTVGNYLFDATGTQLVFMVRQKNAGKSSNALLYYKAGMTKATVLVDDASAGIEDGLRVADNPPRFSAQGSKVFFYLMEKSLPKTDPKMTRVDVWSYKDARLQSLQLKDLGRRKFAAVVSVGDRHIVRLEQPNEMIIGDRDFGDRHLQQNDRFALICRFAGDVVDYYQDHVVATYTMNEYNWNKATWTSVDLVSTETGSRKRLKESGPSLMANLPYYRLSPDGRYVVYYDEARKKYFSYDIASGVARSITENMPVSLASEDSENALRGSNSPVGIVAWQQADAALVISDHYSDLWRVDPSGRTPPRAITNGYARDHELSFQFDNFRTEYPGDINEEPTPVLKSVNEPIFLRTLNRDTRDRGYFRTTLNATGDPQRLMMGPYRYDISKATDENVFIVNRSGPADPDVSFYSRDLKALTPIGADLSKKEAVRGSAGETIQWKGFDGANLHGVLYKPEHFDPNKKYPVIIEYYEKDGSGHVNLSEGFSGDGNPLVHGYIWFRPDIHYVLGEPGPSAYNAVVSGAREIAKLPFVDAAKMGIRGISFGGYETNFIVTHTAMFAAAASESGASDLISLYGSRELDKQGFSQAATIETGQLRIGATPWERLDLYIKNSPIFSVDQVTTPLLMMSNNDDLRVPVNQGVEFFKALRRLGKKAWMLQYDEGAHGAPDPDWSLRMMQFFDYYLKGAPPPKWMTEGIPARLKGVENGLELDTSGQQP